MSNNWNDKKKIGILGGTFNPIHIGHLILGESALQQLELQQVLFMPSKHPPHKQAAQVIDDEHRLNMVNLAIEGNEMFDISLVELEREGLTYTADTIEELVTKTENIEYYFIIGGDSLFQIETWKKPGDILKKTKIVVANRGEYKEEKMREQIEYLEKKYDTSIISLPSPLIDISSSKIRELCKSKKSIRYLVPEKVRNYIEEHQLY